MTHWPFENGSCKASNRINAKQSLQYTLINIFSQACIPIFQEKPAVHKAILDTYKRRVRPLADSIASGSVRCNNKYIFSTCLKITSMVFMFIYIYALEKGKK